jgi:predicted dehydrogenase
LRDAFFAQAFTNIELMQPLTVGIVGLGRSGWDIHARTLQSMNSLYRIAAVTDRDPARRAEAVAALQCRAHDDVAGVLADPAIELIVIASPSHLHAEQAIEALRRGKHVVCEKPMALSVADADRMIDAAERAGRMLSVFQNMRYWPDFLKVREVVQSGVLGRIVQVKLTLHRFTRRWDWQTLREFGGGTLFNAGAHLVDLALQLFGEREPAVTADLQRTLTSGDAEDHVKILLRSADGLMPAAPTIEVEISDACAYPQDAWHIMGTAGGLRGSSQRLEWKWVDFSALPPRPVDASPAAAERKFNREQLIWQERRWEKPPERKPAYSAFYTDLHRSLTQGLPPAITPQSVRRTLAVLEQCRFSAVSGSAL